MRAPFAHAFTVMVQNSEVLRALTLHGPISLDDLAKALQTDAPKLGDALSTLAELGVVTTSNGLYSLNRKRTAMIADLAFTTSYGEGIAA